MASASSKRACASCVIDAVALIVVNVVGGAAAQSDDQPALADVIDQRELLGHADRMMQRHLRHREADLRALRGGRQRGGETDRIDIGADAVEMMFREPDHVEAEFIGQSCLAQGLVDDLAVARGVTAFREQEVAELQAALLCQASGATPTYLN